MLTEEWTSAIVLAIHVGVVHAYVGQKLLKPYILRVFWLTDYEFFHATFN
jgi:hypothetical protein